MNYRNLIFCAVLLVTLPVTADASISETAMVNAGAQQRSATGNAELSPFAVTAKAADNPVGKHKQSLDNARSSYCCSHYVYAANVELYDDFDYDGFYTYVRVGIDIDTDFYASDVYLKTFIRSELGVWRKVYQSNSFTLYGTSALDDYEVEIELVSGFPRDYYEIMIEVYDAYSGALLLDYGVFDNPAFATLPLEDINRDGATAPPIVTVSGTSGGGSVSIGTILALGVLLRRRRHCEERSNPCVIARSVATLASLRGA